MTMVCSTSEQALSKSWHCKKVVSVTNAKIFDRFDKVFKIQIPTKNDADPKRVIDTFSKR